MTFAGEIATGQRFRFGENWEKFLPLVDRARINDAEQSLLGMLGKDALDGARFCDAGSGSGLFSLAARNLGATVVSFDYDPASVKCAEALRERFRPGDDQWTILQGSLLDASFLDSLATFDVVYCWGVVHHTGAMYQAMDNLVRLAAPDAVLYLSVYNDQGPPTRLWTSAKRRFNQGSTVERAAVVLATAGLLYSKAAAAHAWRRAIGAPPHPRSARRGMSTWRDVVDWVGGWPFETATPEAVVDFYLDRQFDLKKLKTVGGSPGCNHYVLRRRPT